MFNLSPVSKPIYKKEKVLYNWYGGKYMEEIIKRIYDYSLEDFDYCKMLRVPTFLDIFKNNENSLRTSHFLKIEFIGDKFTLSQGNVNYTGNLQSL